MKKKTVFAGFLFLFVFIASVAGAYVSDESGWIFGSKDGVKMPISVRFVPRGTESRTWDVYFRGNVENIAVRKTENVIVDRRDAFFIGGTAVLIAVPEREKIEKSAFSGTGRTRNNKFFTWRLYFDNRTGRAWLEPDYEME